MPAAPAAVKAAVLAGLAGASLYYNMSDANDVKKLNREQETSTEELLAHLEKLGEEGMASMMKKALDGNSSFNKHIEQKRKLVKNLKADLVKTCVKKITWERSQSSSSALSLPGLPNPSSYNSDAEVIYAVALLLGDPELVDGILNDEELVGSSALVMALSVITAPTSKIILEVFEQHLQHANGGKGGKELKKGMSGLIHHVEVTGEIDDLLVPLPQNFSLRSHLHDHLIKDFKKLGFSGVDSNYGVSKVNQDNARATRQFRKFRNEPWIGSTEDYDVVLTALGAPFSRSAHRVQGKRSTNELFSKIEFRIIGLTLESSEIRCKTKIRIDDRTGGMNYSYLPFAIDRRSNKEKNNVELKRARMKWLSEYTAALAVEVGKNRLNRFWQVSVPLPILEAAVGDPGISSTQFRLACNNLLSQEPEKISEGLGVNLMLIIPPKDGEGVEELRAEVVEFIHCYIMLVKGKCLQNPLLDGYPPSHYVTLEPSVVEETQSLSGFKSFGTDAEAKKQGMMQVEKSMEQRLVRQMEVPETTLLVIKFVLGFIFTILMHFFGIGNLFLNMSVAIGLGERAKRSDAKRSEPALMKIRAMNPAKFLQTATSTTKLTHSILFDSLRSFCSCFVRSGVAHGVCCPLA